MSTLNLLRLLLLAAIWGASFLFMRLAVPALGPAWLIFSRVALGALFLLAVTLVLRQPTVWRGHRRHFLLLGLLNTALPFLLFAYAARVLPASLLSILNASAPIWGAVITALLQRTLPAWRVQLGLLLGLCGVAVLASSGAMALPAGAGLAVVAGLIAPFCYALASSYAKEPPSVPALANAHGSMWAATLLALPLLPVVPAAGPVTTGALLAVLALGVLCSGVAYLLYFRLVDELGAAAALTVTYLIPVFGVLWGVLFLDERIGGNTLAGGALVLLGTALVTGLSLRQFRGAR
ncbi:DMT family transporter [Chitinilyticum piscinae]|uniref:DMT family transporter n=1 Tax=Chitinilyticum piscinae TaxID=2866724 RepID=A0A8J7K1Z3_9NEIS|nr:DMT family transporter [Chitinilyticum piscinae]MBE9609322.1 DMT family transporter [Chitinilyticum piscinae]